MYLWNQNDFRTFMIEHSKIFMKKQPSRTYLAICFALVGGNALSILLLCQQNSWNYSLTDIILVILLLCCVFMCCSLLIYSRNFRRAFRQAALVGYFFRKRILNKQGLSRKLSPEKKSLGKLQPNKYPPGKLPPRQLSQEDLSRAGIP